MSFINVSINGRLYRMACEPGQEDRLSKLAAGLESRVDELRDRFGEVGDGRLTVMAALMTADELEEAYSRIAAMQDELASLHDVRIISNDRTRVTQNAVAATLQNAAERIEKLTQTLNRSISGGVAIG